ncbi:MAG: hypothetical protein JSS74_00530 [Actinobacteria bacterium]|nr:hypothetical protein [Actinomycetota bacterium]
MTDPQQPWPVPPRGASGGHAVPQPGSAPVPPPGAPQTGAPLQPQFPTNSAFSQRPAGAPPYAQPQYSQPPYGQAPHGRPAAPVYQAPPGAYAGPAGGYTSPLAPAPAPSASPALGRVALWLALVASFGLTIVGAFFAWQIGHGVGAAYDVPALVERLSADDLSVLTPVRDIVLWWEITAWAGTVLGIWAIVQGIVAIAKRRGRGSGIAAIVIAAIGPFVFFIVGYAVGAIGLGVAAAGVMT